MTGGRPVDHQGFAVNQANPAPPHWVGPSVPKPHLDYGTNAFQTAIGMRRSLEQCPEAGWPEMRGAMTYVFVIERGPKCVWAQAPDLAGCVAVGETKGEVRGLIREAIEL